MNLSLSPIRRLSAAVFVLFASTLGAWAQTGTLVGTVSDANSTFNLEGVTVQVTETGASTSTDRDGTYTLRNIPAGTYTVAFVYTGYDRVTRQTAVTAGQTTRLNAEMGGEVFQLEELTVTATFTGQARALNIQRSSESFRSIVASDAFGRFPDANAAEALQRLSGVSIERDQGEGRFVVIRGIDPELNSFSLNGVSLAAPESGTRTIALDVIPTDVLETLEVTKVLTPDMDADGIGGAIDLRTMSAFDRDERVIRGTLQGQYNNLVEEHSFKLSGVYADTFNDGTVGFVLAVTGQERELGSDNTETDGAWEQFDGVNYAPAEIEFREYVITRERFGVSSALEFRPSETSQFNLRFSWNNFSDQEFRYRTELKLEDGTFVSTTPNSGVVHDVPETDRDVKDRYEEQTIMVLSADGSAEVGAYEVDYGLAYSFGEEKEPNRLDTGFRIDEDNPTRLSYDYSGGPIPVIQQLAISDPDEAAAANIFDPANFELDDIVNEFNASEEDEFSMFIDIRRDLDLGDSDGFVQFGAKFRSKEKTNDGNVFVYDGFDGIDYTLADVAGVSPRYNFFPDPSGNFGPRAEAGAARDFFRNNFGVIEEDGDATLEDSSADDFEITEDVFSAYLMGGATWGSTHVFGGFRVEATDVESTGTEVSFDDGGDIEGVTPVTNSQDYVDFLPSIHLRYTPDDQSVVRASIWTSLSRPKIDDLAFRRNVNREDGEVTEGNPELDPYQALNFDISYEYYMPELGLFSVGLFHKQIEDFVFTTTTTDTSPGTTNGFDLTRPLNGESADITGLELVWQQHLGFLGDIGRDFSIYTTVTFTDSSADYGTDAELQGLPFLKQSDMLGTIGLTYDNGDFFIRFAATYRDEYVDAVSDDPAEFEYVVEHLQWDVTTTYQVTEDIKLFAEFVNLNNEPLERRWGVSNGLLQFEEYDWTANFGLKWDL